MPVECKLDSKEDQTTLLALNIHRDIKIKEAENLVTKFKDDKYISANISNGELVVKLRYPIVDLTCIDKDTKTPIIPKFLTASYPIIKDNIHATTKSLITK